MACCIASRPPSSPVASPPWPERILNPLFCKKEKGADSNPVELPMRNNINSPHQYDEHQPTGPHKIQQSEPSPGWVS
uniref:Uncharacterized protein n=1 Tax=Oryza rufipogon TaxID=4529 RepID=A0A0E0P7J4_ORYRU